MYGGFQPASKDDIRRQLYDGMLEFGIYALVLRSLPFVWVGIKKVGGLILSNAAKKTIEA